MSGPSYLAALATGVETVINAKDPAYGAVGDGSTDDGPAIRAALTALPSTGGVVYLPPTANSYRIASADSNGNALTLATAGTFLRGCGINAGRISLAGTFNWGIKANVANCSVTDLYLDVLSGSSVTFGVGVGTSVTNGSSQHCRFVGNWVQWESGAIIPAAPTLTLAAGSNLGTGKYRYAVTFVTSASEVIAGPETSITTTGGNQQVSLTAIPLGGTGTTARKIYRTAVGGAVGTEKLLATIGDNTTTTYTDSTVDGSLGTTIAGTVVTAMNPSGFAVAPEFPGSSSLDVFLTVFDHCEVQGNNFAVDGYTVGNGTAANVLGTSVYDGYASRVQNGISLGGSGVRWVGGGFGYTSAATALTGADINLVQGNPSDCYTFSGVRSENGSGRALIGGFVSSPITVMLDDYRATFFTTSDGKLIDYKSGGSLVMTGGTYTTTGHNTNFAATGLTSAPTFFGAYSVNTDSQTAYPASASHLTREIKNATYSWDGAATINPLPLSGFQSVNDAVATGVGTSVQVFTGSGTYTIPGGASYLEITCVGAGGGGGGGGTNTGSTVSSGGGGGAAGDSRTQVVAVGSDTSYAVTVGTVGTAGNAGGASGNNDGGAGGNGANSSALGNNSSTSVSALGGAGGGAGKSAGTSAQGGIMGFLGTSGNSPQAGGGGVSAGNGGAPTAYSGGGGGGGNASTAAPANGAGGSAGSTTAGGTHGASGSITGASPAANSGAGGGGGGGANSNNAGGAGGTGGTGFVIVKVVG